MGGAPDVTEYLLDWNAGDKQSLERLMPVIYGELRKIAAAQMSRERRDHTLQPTAVVHEAYLRLIDQERVNWRNRAHFFGAAARTMRRLLVDHARRHRAEKRGGGRRVSLNESFLLPQGQSEELLELDDALRELEKVASHWIPAC